MKKSVRSSASALEGANSTPPRPNAEAIHRFVARSLRSEDFALEAFDSLGYQTNVYACTAAAGEYVLRHGRGRADMAKDRYAASMFGRAELSIPRVLAIGRLADKSVLCLSERAPGVVPDEAEFANAGTQLNQRFRQALQAIHTSDVSASTGYGYANAAGQGMLPRWLYAPGVRNVGYRYWARLAGNATIMDKNDFKEVARLQRHLGKFALTDERRLCHGDLKASNVVADEGHLAVIDWARFEYGDPAYDLGILHVRYPGAVDVTAHATAIGLAETYLQERMLYYALGEGLVSMGYFGTHALETELASSEQRLLDIADEASSMF